MPDRRAFRPPNHGLEIERPRPARYQAPAMFTGIVEGTGVIERIEPTPTSIQLTFRAAQCGAGLKLGESIAVNGCCLTVVRLGRPGKNRRIGVDLLHETWKRTNLQFVQPGSLVNLERPLRANDRLGGHFVTGHVDGLGKIIRWERSGQDWVLDISAPADVMDYMVFKGSVAVDGISLTVAAVERKHFRIWIIPHTYEVTNLRTRQAGDAVNLEADLLGKYVQQFLKARS